MENIIIVLWSDIVAVLQTEKADPMSIRDGQRYTLHRFDLTSCDIGTAMNRR